jgi:hypothetical protein
LLTLHGTNTTQREYWLTDVLHESYQTVDEQREMIVGTLHPIYTPLDLAVPWILEKAAEVEQAQPGSEADIEATFVVPRWLTRKHCDRQIANIEFWKGTGGISEAEAEQPHLCPARRESCQVGPKDGSWPMHSGGSTAVKG